MIKKSTNYRPQEQKINKQKYYHLIYYLVNYHLQEQNMNYKKEKKYE